VSIFIDWTWGDINNGDVGPGMFSWFHILWLGIMIIASVVMALTVAKKHSPKCDHIVISVFAVMLAICEVFKQLFWFEFYGYYRWEIFPFQFCSVPIYISVFAALVPSDKVREVCYRFLAFFGIIGGIAVMAVPTAVLYTYFVSISIHSMVWHAILIAMGAFLIVSRGYGRNFKELLAPFIMYLGCIVTAIIGNILVYKLHLGTDACQPGDNLSMFYISPYYPTQLPVLGIVQEFSYPLFVVCYIAFFSALTLLVWFTANRAWKAVDKKKK
jgi:uncharacterized membrane protein YwaF